MSALAIVDRVLYGEWDNKGGDKFTQVTNFLSIFTSVVLLYGGRRLRVKRLAHYLPFLLVALMLVSASWSMDPAVTLRRALNYAILVAGALGMAHAVTPLRTMKITVWVCAVAALISLAISKTPYGLLYSPDTGNTDFRGVFGLKNMLGEGMVAGVLAALYCFVAVPRGKAKYAMLLVLFLGVIVAAKSATSLLVSLSYIVALMVMTLHARGGVARLMVYGVFVGGMLLLGVVLAMPEVLLQALGKDATLTGRTDLWPYVIAPILTKPILGWGLNGFWMFSNPAAMQISGALGWFVPEAHNGLLELLLSLGVVGTGLVIAQIIRCCVLAERCMRRGNVYLGRITVAFIIGLLIMSVSEAILLTPSQIPTLQFFLYGFMCETSLLAAGRPQIQSRYDATGLRLRRMEPYSPIARSSHERLVVRCRRRQPEANGPYEQPGAAS